MKCNKIDVTKCEVHFSSKNFGQDKIMDVLATPVRKAEPDYLISSTAFRSPPTSVLKSRSRQTTPEWIIQNADYPGILSSPIPSKDRNHSPTKKSNNQTKISKYISIFTHPLIAVVLIILALVISFNRPEMLFLVVISLFILILLFRRYVQKNK